MDAGLRSQHRGVRSSYAFSVCAATAQIIFKVVTSSINKNSNKGSNNKRTSTISSNNTNNIPAGYR